MKHNFIWLAAGVMLLISSCGVKNYRPVEFAQKDSLIRGNYSSVDTVNVADMAWRYFYTDPHLQALIEEGLRSNTDLRTALLRIDQAAAYYKKSKGDLFPTLNAAASAQYGNNYQDGTANEMYNFGVSAAWEIDIWGKIRNAKKAKFASLLAQESSKNAIITQLIGNIATAYYSLLAYDTQKRLVERTIENRISYYKTVKQLKESAQVNEVAVLQAEAQLYMAQGYIPSIEKAIRITENSLNFLLGRVPGPINRVADLDIQKIELTEVPEGISAQLLTNRPDVMAAEKNVMSYFYNLKSAKASMYPALTLSGNTGFDAMSLTNWFNASSAAWSLAAGLTQPIFNGRALRTQKEVAASQYEEAVTNFRATVLNAGMEASNALHAINANTELATYYYKQYIALGKAYEFSVDLLVNGYGTYLDVLSAQEGVFNAQLAFISSTLDFLNSKIELYRALGGGWKE